MPEKARSSRTTLVKRPAWDLAESDREAKSDTAMRGFSTPRPVPVRNQSCEKEGQANGRRMRKPRKSGGKSVRIAKEWAARGLGDKITSSVRKVREEL